LILDQTINLSMQHESPIIDKMKRGAMSKLMQQGPVN